MIAILFSDLIAILTVSFVLGICFVLLIQSTDWQNAKEKLFALILKGKKYATFFVKLQWTEWYHKKIVAHYYSALQIRYQMPYTPKIGGKNEKGC